MTRVQRYRRGRFNKGRRAFNKNSLDLIWSSQTNSFIFGSTFLIRWRRTTTTTTTESMTEEKRTVENLVSVWERTPQPCNYDEVRLRVEHEVMCGCLQEAGSPVLFFPLSVNRHWYTQVYRCSRESPRGLHQQRTYSKGKGVRITNCSVYKSEELTFSLVFRHQYLWNLWQTDYCLFSTAWSAIQISKFESWYHQSVKGYRRSRRT